MGLWGKIKNKTSDAYDWTKEKGKEAGQWYDDATNRDQGNNLGKLEDEANRASAFASQRQDQFSSMGAEAGQERDYMRRIARGQESVSAMQLSQALAQNQAQQQSMAAGARPGNAAMAARTAAITAGRQGAGLAGQQAMAGIQERQAAQGALSNALLQQRQQELSAINVGRGQAINGLGGAYKGAMNTPTGLEKGLGLIETGAKAYAGMG